MLSQPLWEPEAEPSNCINQADGITNRVQEISVRATGLGYGTALRNPLISVGRRMYLQKESPRISYIKTFMQAEFLTHINHFHGQHFKICVKLLIAF